MWKTLKSVVRPQGRYKLVTSVMSKLTDYRYCREGQLPAAGRIAALKDMGFSLADIVRIFEVYDDCEKLEPFI